MNKPIALFCNHCGKQLADKYVFSHYHSYNGEKVFCIVSTCPDRKFIISRHTKHWRGRNSLMGISVVFLYSEFYEDGSEIS